MIRKYSRTDFSAVQEIYRLCKPDEFRLENDQFDFPSLVNDPMNLNKFLESEVYVYERETVVGFIAILNNHIEWLYVHPDFRKMGIGKSLLFHATSLFKEGSVLTLSTIKSNKTALQFYKKHQFNSVEEYTVSVHGKNVEVCKLSLLK